MKPAFPALSALEAGYEVFVVTDASGTFNPAVRHAAWTRMANAGVQLMNWFSVACELQRDWRHDIDGLSRLLSTRLPAYRNLITSYTANAKIISAKQAPMQRRQRRGMRPLGMSR